MSLPEILRNQVIITSAISQKFVLLATPNTLFCWDTEKNTTFSVALQKVVLVHTIQCKNSKAGISSFADQECVFVVVALKSGEIRLYNLYLTLQKFE